MAQDTFQLSSLGSKSAKGTSPSSLERTRNRPPKHVVSPDGVHFGGSCKGQCGGKPLGFWINYQLCDNCLKVTKPDTTKAT
jgi:hypothetical protein